MKTILVDAINTFVSKEDGIFVELHDLLEEYENTKIIVTNANDEQMKAYGLDEMPYDVFTLKHNSEKSDSQYFAKLLKRYGLESEQVVYIEHDPRAIQAAEDAGIVTHYFDPEEQNVEIVKEFLDANV